MIKTTGIIKKIVRSIENYDIDYHYSEKIDIKEIREQIETLSDIFLKEIRGGVSGSFNSKFNDIIKGVSVRNGSFNLWNYIVSQMRTVISPYLRGSRQIHYANDLWQQARVNIAEAVHRKDLAKNHHYLNRGEILRLISSKLITTYNQKNLMNVLAESLPKLDIGSCFLSIYEKESQTDGKIPQWSRIILAFKNNQVLHIDDTEARFLSKDLVPACMLSEIKNNFYIIESLYFQEIMIGFVLFKHGPKDGYIYEGLRGQLSSALYGSLIMEERSYVKELLEKTLNSMKNKASTVSYNSKNISDHINGISISMEEVAASIKEISNHINTVMNIINEAVSVTNYAKNDIIELSDNSKKIAQVVDIINDIAEQTSVLALNAAIQASHAGKAGKGFNVVAGEVKELSKKTVTSTQEIFEMINNNRSSSMKSAEAINYAVDLIKQISDLSYTINEAISQQTDTTGEVSKVLIEAAKGSNEITDAISEVAKLGADIESARN